MSNIYNSVVCTFCIYLACFAQGVYAKEVINIAVASNFKAPLQTVLADAPFIDDYDVKLSAASSGILYTQIKHGAPFDIFLSADQHRPTQLVAEGLAYPHSLATYAQGVLALWQPSANLPNHFIAIANPRFSPYGVASQYYLNKHFDGGYKRILANNITQAFQYIDSGNAALGLVALSTLKWAYSKDSQVKYLQFTELPSDKYPKIVQKGVILKSTEHKRAAERVMDHLLSESVQQRFNQFGYKSE
nr:molybdate ABC transporter substrate-binding protein [Pseudoalteromonas shioyasakiensis]